MSVELDKIKKFYGGIILALVTTVLIEAGVLIYTIAVMNTDIKYIKEYIQRQDEINKKVIELNID